MCSLSLKPVLPTARLTLRPPSAQDAPAIAKHADDFDVAKMTLRLPHPYGLEEARSFLSSLDDPLAKDKMVFAIEAPDQGLIGVLGFHGDDMGRPALGYWLGKPYWGNGYATEAVRAALRWARVEWGRKVIFAGHAVENAASAGVLIKAGFLYTGEVAEQYSVARGELCQTRMMVWLA